MASVSKVLLSGSSGGRMIKVTLTATTGDLIHATTTVATTLDEIWLWGQNTSTADVKATVEWGGTTVPDDQIEQTIPAESGLIPLVRGWPLAGTGAAARNVRVFAGSANVINVGGFVNRISTA